MITSFDCTCGNTDPKKAHFHDGMLGYEAFVCKCCGKYYDNEGSHDCDEWSKQFLIKTKWQITHSEK